MTSLVVWRPELEAERWVNAVWPTDDEKYIAMSKALPIGGILAKQVVTLLQASPQLGCARSRAKRERLSDRARMF